MSGRAVKVDLREWSAPRQFDFVECGGVLHHLEDPEAAWARLSGALRDGGTMSVSLYSRAARQPLKEIRGEILREVCDAQRNCGASGGPALRNRRPNTGGELKSERECRPKFGRNRPRRLGLGIWQRIAGHGLRRRPSSSRQPRRDGIREGAITGTLVVATPDP